MKRLVALVILVAACAVMSGCNEANTRRGGCATCGRGGGGGLGGRHADGQCRGCGVGGLLAGGLCSNCAKNNSGGQGAAGGGPMGQYAYPYYTVRGPRDFLVNNPPSIGP